MSVETHAAAGKNIEVPRPDCPSCSAPMTFWHGYPRLVRVGGEFLTIWIRRARCLDCLVSHGILPSFLLVGRYDPVEVIGGVIEAVARLSTRCGVRPAAEAAHVPATTARDWTRRFFARAAELAVAFSACAIEFGGALVTTLTTDARRDALAAIEAAFEAASVIPTRLELGPFGFCSCVTGGRLIAANSNPPVMLLGRCAFRRFRPRGTVESGQVIRSKTDSS